MSKLKLHFWRALPNWARGGSRFLIIFSLLVSAVVIVVAPLGLMESQQICFAEVTDRIVAIVNKDIITMSDLEEEMGDERKRLRARYDGEELKQRVAHKQYDVLNTLIERRLQLQEAETKGLTVSDEEVKQALKQVTMEQMGTPFAGSVLKRQVRERLILEKLWNYQIRQNVMVSDSEITQYYEDHIDEFFVPPTYQLRQILFLVRVEQDEVQARLRADRVYLALKTNGNFAELAKQYSDGPEATEGGALGKVRQDELLTPIAQALQTMKPGDISKPIKSNLGYHIIALDEVTPSKAKEFEEVEIEIKSLLYKRRSDETFRKWLAGLKKKAFIEIKF